jgi:hypothetical protein
MLINGKQFSELEEVDLRFLLEDKVAEGKHIEYKKLLPSNSDRDKKEFLADVSSFLNSAGGYIFYGISESNGLPVELAGLDDIDPDAQILRFENLLRDAIAPRPSGVSIRAMSIVGKGPVLALHIPKSWASPHMITFAGSSKFFSRNSAGKYPLDVFELRTEFNASNIVQKDLINFRIDRIGKIVSSETPVSLEIGAKVILHLIPLSAFVSPVKYDLREFHLSPNRRMLDPIHADNSSNFRFNFDGILTWEQYQRSSPAISYLQLFRSGIVESVNTSLFDGSAKAINSIMFEQEIIEALDRFFLVQNSLETEPPYFLFLSLIGVHGYSLPTSTRLGGRFLNLIDRNDLLVPEIVVEDISVTASAILRPAFDAVWNAAGKPQSPSYDSEGNWNPNTKQGRSPIF